MLIAHFSDLHQLALSGARPADWLGKRLVGGLNLLLNRGGEFPTAVVQALLQDVREQRPDHIIVSGDFTNLALPAEFELAGELLANMGVPPSAVTLVPGNHDYYTRQSAVDDGFAKTLAPYLQGELQPGPSCYPFVQLRGEVALLALSTARPSPVFMAWGTLGNEQLRLAEELLGSAECRRRFRVVVLHHPPHGLHRKWHARLTDAAAFTALLERVGADLVVHGHLHRFVETCLPGPSGPIPVIGVGSGTWLSPRDPSRRAQYHLYRIESRALVARSSRRYDSASGTFSAVGA